MEIMERLTEALAYIEENLMNEINYTEVAKRAYCSSDGFKRVFSIIAGISPAEYVRRRRMTLAALELKDSNCKIIDIALKYGYESPGSFTRAFSSIHGLTPSDVRKSKVSLTAFPRLFFKIHIKGANEMNYRIEKMEKFNVFGREGLISNQNGTDTFAHPGVMWQKFNEDGGYEKILKSTGYEQTPGLTDMCRIHAVYNYKKTTGESWPYMICTFQGENSLIENFDVVEIPASTWAIFPSEYGFEWGNIGQILSGLHTRINSEWLPMTKYKKTSDLEFEIYGGTAEKGYIEIWIPIKLA